MNRIYSKDKSIEEILDHNWQDFNNHLEDLIILGWWWLYLIAAIAGVIIYHVWYGKLF